MDLIEVRHDVWLHAKKMWEAGLVVASAGNVSRRVGPALIAITMESCARVYLQAMQSGEPVLLPDDAIAAGRRLFEEKYRV